MIKNIAFHRYKKSVNLKPSELEKYEMQNEKLNLMKYRVNYSELKKYQGEEYREYVLFELLI